MKIKGTFCSLCAASVLALVFLGPVFAQPAEDPVTNALNNLEGSLRVTADENLSVNKTEGVWPEVPAENAPQIPAGTANSAPAIETNPATIPQAAPAPAPSMPSTPSSTEAPSIEVSSSNNVNIDLLELKDMDINDVLKLISTKTGLNIVTGQNVKGRVTIYLKNVDVHDVLRIILESNDLAYAEESGIIRVMTDQEFERTYGQKFGEKTKLKTVQLKFASAADAIVLLTQMKSIIGKVIADEKSNTIVLMDIPEKLEDMEAFLHNIDVPVATKVFQLSYAEAEDISKKVTETLTRNVGTLKFDKRSNKIIVTDTPQKLKEIAEIVREFDEKHGEVLIEAKILQIILSDEYKMGVDWEAIVSDFHSLDLKNSLSILGTDDKKGKLSIGTLSSDDYTVLIEALDTVGKTNNLSSPRITAVNNQEAKILVGSTEPYVTSTTTTPASGPTTTSESVNFIDVGVKLYVTPTIHKDNYITMKIKPEVSSVTRFVTTGNNNRIPVVETSEAETTVMVKDGVTIVIGGLIKDEKIDTLNKVPILGDIPVLGFMFRNRDKLTRKTELAIFLTPKIISGDVPENSEDASIQSQK